MENIQNIFFAIEYKHPYKLSEILAGMESWKSAYLIVIVILLLYIVKSEYEHYYHDKRLKIAKEAKSVAAHALVLSENTSDPNAQKMAKAASYLANEADTSTNYADTVYYKDMTVMYANAVQNSVEQSPK